MFTVSMALPQTPQAVFSEAFTDARLQEQVERGRIGPDNPPVYISSVAYGRILMFSFTSSAALTDINGTISALYNGGEFGGHLSAEYQNVLDNAQIQVVTVGGDATHALSLIRSNDLASYFTDDASLTAARPISYTVRSLSDNAIASVSETTQYNLKQCTPASVPLVGATYQLRLTKIEAIDLPNIDGLPPDWWDIELLYTINVETLEGVVKTVRFEPTFFENYAARLQEGDAHILSDSPLDVEIHFDGHDFVEIWGTIGDWDSASAIDVLPFRRRYQYPSQAMAAGQSWVNATDSAGNKVRIFYTLVKTGDL
jgi:hypothetical protein